MASPADLLEALDDLGAVPWSGEAYRHTAPHYPAISGSGASAIGGRWNPTGVSTIYLATPIEACVAEFMRRAKGQARGVQSFLPRDLHVISVHELQVVDLTVEDARKAVGIRLENIEGADRSACQEVGQAAHYLGFQGILAPSATHVGLVLACFERNIQRGQLTVRSTFPLDTVLSGQDQ
jgi:RES domain-containing protein